MSHADRGGALAGQRSQQLAVAAGLGTIGSAHSHAAAVEGGPAPVAILGGLIHKLVMCRVNVVCKLDLCNRRHTLSRCPDGKADNALPHTQRLSATRSKSSRSTGGQRCKRFHSRPCVSMVRCRPDACHSSPVQQTAQLGVISTEIAGQSRCAPALIWVC